MDANAALIEESKRIQASGVLGEARLRRLFDYLAASSLTGASPKEITIAIDVFGKGPDFDASQDAVVRVYMHKLRRTLDEFYSVHGSEGVTPLHIPRGEYRLALNLKARLTPAPAGVASETLTAQRRTRRSSQRLIGLLGVVAGAGLAAVALLVGFGVLRWRTPATDLELARANPIWSAILKDDRPLLVVVGDYYLIGETDESMEVKRLIREYSVNSKAELENYV
jgi:hypothetical protein